MVEWSALQEIDTKLQKVEELLRNVLAEVRGCGSFAFGEKNSSNKQRSQAKAIINKLSSSDEIQSIRFLVESALAEKASPLLVAECLVHQLLPRAKYHIDLPKQAFLADLYALLEEAEPVSCLAIFRGMLNLGRSVRFVPPPAHIADKAFAEEARLHAQMRDLIRFEQIQKTFD